MPEQRLRGRAHTKTTSYDADALARVRKALGRYKDDLGVGWDDVATAIHSWDYVREFFPGALKRSLPPISEDTLGKFAKGVIGQPTPPKAAAIAAFLCDQRIAYEQIIDGFDNPRPLQEGFQNYLGGPPSFVELKEWTGDYRAVFELKENRWAWHRITVALEANSYLVARYFAVQAYPAPSETHEAFSVSVGKLKADDDCRGWVAIFPNGHAIILTRSLLTNGGTQSFISRLENGGEGLSIRWADAARTTDAAKQDRIPIEIGKELKESHLYLENLHYDQRVDYNLSRNMGSLTDLVNAIMSKDDFDAASEPWTLSEADIQLLTYAPRGDVEQVRDALAKGADINCRHWDNGITALHYAAMNGYKDLLEVLLKHPDVNPTLRSNNDMSASAYALHYQKDFITADRLTELSISYRKTNPDTATPPLFPFIK